MNNYKFIDVDAFKDPRTKEDVYSIFNSLNNGIIYCKEPNYKQICLPPPSMLSLPDFTIRDAHLYNSNIFTRPKEYLVMEFNVENISPDVPEHLSGTLSEHTTDNISRLFYKANTFGHEFCTGFLIFGDNIEPRKAFLTTEIPLINLNDIGDGNDNLTPDGILKANDILTGSGCYWAIEYSTSLSSNEMKLRQRFEEKKTKYYYPLMARINTQPQQEQNLVNKIIFSILVVSPDGVYSNMDLTNNIIYELVVRFKIYQLAISQLKIQGWSTLELDRPDPFENIYETQRVRTVFDSIKLKWPNPIREYIDEDFYNEISKPPDLEYIHTVLNNERSETIKQLCDENHITKSDEGYADIACQFLDAVDSLQSTFNERSSELKNQRVKPIIQLPFCVPIYNLHHEEDTSSIKAFPSVDFEEINQTDDDELKNTLKLYNQINNSIQKGEYGFIEESLEKEREIAMAEDFESLEKKAKEQRNLYRRIKVSLDYEEELALAQSGIWGRKYKENIFLKYEKSISKLCYSMDVFIEDINECISDSDSLFDLIDDSYIQKDVMNFLRDSTAMHTGPNVPNKIMNLVLQTKGYGFMRMITEIAIELSLSFRQFAKRSQVIVKKLLSCDVYIVIKPTSLQGPLFYSLIFPENSILDPNGVLNLSSVFKRLYKVNGFYYTKFSSVNSEKISNMVKAESMYISLFFYWAEFYGIPYAVYDDDHDGYIEALKRTDMSKMLFISMLILLENKTTTEELITLTRFIMMEGFVSPPMLPKPHKMLKKITAMKMHSRLQIWLVNRIIVAIGRIIDSRGFRLGCNEDGKFWENMFNIFTGSTIKDPWHLVNLMYLGYLKDKNEKAEKNTLGHLYEKILVLEDERPQNNDYLTSGDPFNPKRHEFSMSFVKYLVSLAKEKLSKSRGINYEKEIENTILHELAFKSLLSISTIKASSNFSDEWYRFDPNKKYYRSRVVEKINNLLLVKDDNNQSTGIMDLIVECLDYVEQNEAMHICLFKKNQHGGLREIYVLGIHERIIQAAIETIARSICKFFISETMTNPTSKVKIPAMHCKAAEKQFGSGYRTIGCSADAEKWNQGHFVTKFMIMLCSFTPKYMHPFIIRSLSIFLRKRIMIDPELIKIFLQNESNDFGDSITGRMKDAYLGLTQERWIEKGKSYIETETGMMQGILHYTSSLFHTIYQEWLQDYFTRDLKLAVSKFVPSIHLKKKTPIVNVMQSSDDSAVLISFPTGDTVMEEQLVIACNFLFKLKANLGKYIGIYDSIKTTAGTLEVLEFNSEFFFSDSQIRPTMRWIAAATTITERESLCGRQEELYNCLTSVISGGGSFSLAHMIQCAQMLIHYRLLGYGSCLLFHEFYNELKILGDPSLGFFLMDNPFCPGLLGFSYSVYRVIQSVGTFTLNQSYSFSLMSLMEQYQRVGSAGYGDLYKMDKCVEMTSSNSLIHVRQLALGDKKRWQRLINNMALPDWRTIIDENPDILYRHPDNVLELRVRLAAMVHSPGIAESLSQANAVINTIASCVYAITRHVITDYAYWDKYPDTELIPKKYKISLLQKTIMRQRDIKDKAFLTLDQKRTLFPHLISYLQFDESFDKIKEIHKDVLVSRYTGKLKRKTTTINVLDSSNINTLQPLSILKWKWFRGSNIAPDIVGHPSSIEQCFSALQEQFPWIHKDIKETLKRSPFSNHIQLQNFFARLESKPREVVISGIPVHAIKGYSNLFTAVQRNYFPGYQISGISDITAAERAGKLDSTLHHIRMIQTYPFTHEKRCSSALAALKDVSLTEIDLVHKSPRIATLSFIIKIANRAKKSELTKKATVDGKEVILIESQPDDWTFIKETHKGFFGAFDNCLSKAYISFFTEEPSMPEPFKIAMHAREIKIPKKFKYRQEDFPKLSKATTNLEYEDKDEYKSFENLSREEKINVQIARGGSKKKYEIKDEPIKKNVRGIDITFSSKLTKEERRKIENEQISKYLNCITKPELVNKQYIEARRYHNKMLISLKQKKYLTKFTGVRVYRGYFGDDQFVITLFSHENATYIASIDYTNEYNISLFLSQLKIRANELGILNDCFFPAVDKDELSYHENVEYRKISYCYNFTTATFGGAPIYIRSFKQEFLMPKGHFFIDISGQYLKLKFHMKPILPAYYSLIDEAFTSSFTVLSLATNDNDALVEIVPAGPYLSSEVKPPHIGFIENRPIKDVNIDFFIKSCYGYTVGPDIYKFRPESEWSHPRGIDSHQLFNFIVFRLKLLRKQSVSSSTKTEVSLFQTALVDPDLIAEFSEGLLSGPELESAFDLGDFLMSLKQDIQDDKWVLEAFDYAFLVDTERTFAEINPKERYDMINKAIPNNWLNGFNSMVLQLHADLLRAIETNNAISHSDRDRAHFLARLYGINENNIDNLISDDLSSIDQQSLISEMGLDED